MNDFKSNKFVKTPIGNFPLDWTVYSLGEVLETIRNGTSEKQNTEGKGKPVTRIETISEGKVNFSKVGYIDTEEDLSDYKLQKGDILFSHINSIKHIGKIAIYNGESPLYHGMNLLLLRPNNKVKPQYLYYLLSTHSVKKYYESNAKQAINQASLNQKDVISLSFALPNLIEQEKIVTILSKVDEAIEKTEAIIEQTEKVKKGLMQQLLTKGIGHTKFKKTEIGEIPEKWEVLSVANVANTTSGGTPSRNKPEYFNGSIPWIKTGELKEKYIYDTEEKITEEAVKNSSAKLIPKNSIIVAMYGATIGQVSINKIDATTNQACCVIIPQKEKLNYEFLYYLLTFWKTKLIKLGAGGAQPNISQQIIKNLLIPIPSIKEQIEIANILTTLDKKVQNEKKKFDTLSKLKKSLMQSLLTGKVRVKVDDEVVSS